jgi:hypothetical protein
VTNAREKTKAALAVPVEMMKWLDSRQEFLKFGLGKADSTDSILCISFLAVVLIALLPFHPNNGLTLDITRLIPGPIWTVVSWINLGVIKGLIFKAIVCSGFFAQNWTRLMMTLTVIIAVIYKLAHIISYGTEASRSFKRYEMQAGGYNSPSSRTRLLVGTDCLGRSFLLYWCTNLQVCLSNLIKLNIGLIPISV